MTRYLLANSLLDLYIWLGTELPNLAPQLERLAKKKQKIQKKTTALRVYSSIIIILYNFFCALFIASPHKSTYGEPYYGVLLVKQLRIKMGKAQGWMRRG